MRKESKCLLVCGETVLKVNYILGFLAIIISSALGGFAEVLMKKTVTKNGVYKAIAYNYVGILSLLFLGALVSSQSFSFPFELIFPYIVQIIIGAISIIALFKAFEKGKPSILVSFTNLYVLIVLLIAIFILGEKLSIFQILGIALLILSGFILAFKDLKDFKLESGILLCLITIFGWGYYWRDISSCCSCLWAFTYGDDGCFRRVSL